MLSCHILLQMFTSYDKKAIKSYVGSLFTYSQKVIERNYESAWRTKMLFWDSNRLAPLTVSEQNHNNFHGAHQIEKNNLQTLKKKKAKTYFKIFSYGE